MISQFPVHVKYGLHTFQEILPHIFYIKHNYV